MSLEQLERSVLELTREDRQRLFDWLIEHELELLGGGALDAEVKAEILRRRDEATAHPERLAPWEGTVEQVRRRLHEIRHQEAEGR